MYSKNILGKKLSIGLNTYKIPFKLIETHDCNIYEVLHLKIHISDRGIEVRGKGIKEKFKAIDFRISPTLENEVIDEIMAYVRDPARKSVPLWRQLFIKRN